MHKSLAWNEFFIGISIHIEIHLSLMFTTLFIIYFILDGNAAFFIYRNQKSRNLFFKKAFKYVTHQMSVLPSLKY